MAPLSPSVKLARIYESLPPEIALLRGCDVGRSTPRAPLPTGVEALDTLLSGGLPRGGLVELSGERSAGRFSTVLSTLASATRMGENAAFVDLSGGLDPQGAEEAGIDLSRLLWIRPGRLKEALRSAEIALAAGFALVAVDLGLPPLGGRAPEAAWVRLARSARQRGSALFLSTPYPVSGSEASAALRLRLERPVWEGEGLSPRLLCGVAAAFTLEKKRGESPGQVARAEFRVAGAELRGSLDSSSDRAESNPGATAVFPSGKRRGLADGVSPGPRLGSLGTSRPAKRIPPGQCLAATFPSGNTAAALPRGGAVVLARPGRPSKSSLGEWSPAFRANDGEWRGSHPGPGAVL
jgi:hypothetical protein